MITAGDIKRVIENYAPPALAEDFDNVGLLVGDSEKCVKKILLTLDVDEQTAMEAVSLGADMIVSHHPVIFTPPKSVTNETALGRTLMTLIKNSVAVLSAHTNMDKAKGGLNDLMAERLGLSIEEDVSDAEKCIRICRADTTLGELASCLKSEYNVPHVKFTGNPERVIKRVGICTGGGRSMAEDAAAAKCDVFISGDLHYSDIRDLVFSGVDFIEIGHYYSEYPVTEIFKSVINAAYPEISTIISKEKDVFLNNF